MFGIGTGPRPAARSSAPGTLAVSVPPHHQLRTPTAAARRGNPAPRSGVTLLQQNRFQLIQVLLTPVTNVNCKVKLINQRNVVARYAAQCSQVMHNLPPKHPQV